MTEESDLFCMILSACRGMIACFRLRTEAAAAGNDCPHEKIFNSVFLLFRGLEMCYHTQ